MVLLVLALMRVWIQSKPEASSFFIVDMFSAKFAI